MPVAALAVPAITAGLTAAGVGGGLATAGGLLGGVALGAGTGAGLGALTGQGAGKGAELGAISTAGAEAGGALGNLAGFPGVGSAVGGALGGALGGVATGTNPITGAAEGLAFGMPSPISVPSLGIGTPVPAEATAGAVQPLGAPSSSAIGTPLASGTQLASGGDISSMSADVGGGASGGGNVGPFDVTDMSVGPPAGSTVQSYMGTLQPTAATGGGMQTPTTTTPSLVGPQGGPLTPPADATPAAPAGAPGIIYPGMGDMGGDIPATNVETAPPVTPLGSNPTWWGQPTTPGEAAYNAAPGASKGIVGSIADMIKSPSGLAGLATAGAGLYQMINTKRQQAAELKPLETAATGAQGMATALTAPSLTGVLPVGESQALENERRKRFAAIEGQAAKTGMSGSTQEMDAKQAANADIAEQQVGIEQNLLKQAYGYTNLATNEVNQIFNAKQVQDKQYADALSSFVKGLAAMAGPSKATTTTTTTTAPATA